jgi:hypothetical protein
MTPKYLVSYVCVLVIVFGSACVNVVIWQSDAGAYVGSVVVVVPITYGSVTVVLATVVRVVEAIYEEKQY